MNEDAFEAGDYIPSTIEKKRVITMLLFMGIVMSLARQKQLSPYERYYLSIALSVWTTGLLIFFIATIVMIITRILWYLFVTILLLWLFLLVFLLQQAWAWRYNHKFVVIRFFRSVGERLLLIFWDDGESTIWTSAQSNVEEQPSVAKEATTSPDSTANQTNTMSQDNTTPPTI